MKKVILLFLSLFFFLGINISYSYNYISERDVFSFNGEKYFFVDSSIYKVKNSEFVKKIDKWIGTLFIDMGNGKYYFTINDKNYFLNSDFSLEEIPNGPKIEGFECDRYYFYNGELKCSIFYKDKYFSKTSIAIFGEHLYYKTNDNIKLVTLRSMYPSDSNSYGNSFRDFSFDYYYSFDANSIKNVGPTKILGYLHNKTANTISTFTYDFLTGEFKNNNDNFRFVSYPTLKYDYCGNYKLINYDKTEFVEGKIELGPNDFCGGGRKNGTGGVAGATAGLDFLDNGPIGKFTGKKIKIEGSTESEKYCHEFVGKIPYCKNGERLHIFSKDDVLYSDVREGYSLICQKGPTLEKFDFLKPSFSFINIVGGEQINTCGYREITQTNPPNNTDTQNPPNSENPPNNNNNNSEKDYSGFLGGIKKAIDSASETIKNGFKSFVDSASDFFKTLKGYVDEFRVWGEKFFGENLEIKQGVDSNVLGNFSTNGEGFLNITNGEINNPIVIDGTKCKIFDEGNLSFLYYGSGVSSINFSLRSLGFDNAFSGLLDFLSGIIIGPLNNIIGLTRIVTPFTFDNQRVCLFGEVKTIKFHNMMKGTDYYGKMTFFDYLVIFSFGAFVFFIIGGISFFRGISHPSGGWSGYKHSSYSQKGIVYTPKPNDKYSLPNPKKKYKYGEYKIYR